METIRLTAAQALVRWLSVQMIENAPSSSEAVGHEKAPSSSEAVGHEKAPSSSEAVGQTKPPSSSEAVGQTKPPSSSEAVGQAKSERFIEGIWAIFGHGNVAGLGEALWHARGTFPTWRGQNEQTMAHAAIAYAKTMRRRRAMAVTSSIGPGSTNLVTAAALAHVNRLPVLLIPSDIFAGRGPDPVLQQIEDFDDGTVSANDALRPVSRYFDRILRPEQVMTALPRALAMMTDPANCGPATLAFPQDVQAEAWDYPASFFDPKVWRIRRPAPDPAEVAEVARMMTAAERPLIVSGGGVIYSEAEGDLLDFAKKHNVPVVETQAGKGALSWEEPLNFGSPGVTGSGVGNDLAAESDLVLGIGTRFQDFTTGSWTVFSNPARKLVSINLTGYDATKHNAVPLVADARAAIRALDQALGDVTWADQDKSRRAAWFEATEALCAAPNHADLPTDAQVIGAVQRQATPDTVAMCAAGSMPGYLQVLWRASAGGYHVEYGYSCMGYEVAGAIGVKLAAPEREVICFVGDGSYMMANSELATAVMRRVPFTVVLTDNRGFGCINRLQKSCGGAEFNNLYASSDVAAQPEIDFVAHAGAMGAHAEKAADIADLEAKIVAARARDIPTVIVIDTTPYPDKEAGGHWWEVAVPEVSEREDVRAAYKHYAEMTAKQARN